MTQILKFNNFFDVIFKIFFLVQNQQENQVTISTSSHPTTASTATIEVENNENSSKVNQSSVEIEDEFIEKVVLHEDELNENEMKEIVMNDDGQKILLIKQNGKITALGTKCSHYGASLVDGALGNGRIRCAWHGACFNITTGDIEDFPGQDSLPCHQVKVENGLVTVRAKKSELETQQRIRKMTKTSGIRGHEIIVIIGGGPASQTCAETLRENHFRGRIVMVCKENHLPYDRVKISKFMNLESEKLELRTRPFYDANEIEIMLNTEATSLDTSNNEISLSTGTKLIYDKLFIATGSRARTLTNVIGNDLKNIFTLRTMNDAHNLDEELKSTSRVIIIGSSFIAMEAASYCISKNVSKVTIVGRSSTPLNDTFGEAIGQRIMELFISKNVEFVMNSELKSFVSINQEESFSGIKLANGHIIQGDICIIGIGSYLNTDFLRDSELTINNDGSIDGNLYLQTNIENVWVGGDIAKAPIFTNNNNPSTIGHYALAQYHGKIAALNMIGIKTELRAVPYFFTYFFGKIFNYVGHGKVHEIFVEGDLDELSFVGFYFDEDGFIVGMSSCQPDKSVAEFAEKLFEGRRYHKNDIEWVDQEETEIQQIELDNKVES